MTYSYGTWLTHGWHDVFTHGTFHSHGTWLVDMGHGSFIHERFIICRPNVCASCHVIYRFCEWVCHVINRFCGWVESHVATWLMDRRCDSFICYMWDMTHSYVTCETWLVHMGHDLFTWLAGEWPTSNVTHAYGTWLVHMWHMGHDSFMWDMTHSRGTWLIRMTCRRVAHEQCDSCIWDMSRSYVPCGTWLVHMGHDWDTWLAGEWPMSKGQRDSRVWHMTHSYVTRGTWLIHMGHDSFTWLVGEWPTSNVTHVYEIWLIHMWHDAFIWDMTPSYRAWLTDTGHDSFVSNMTHGCKTWRTGKCAHERVATWLMHMWRKGHERGGTWLIRMWRASLVLDMTQFYLTGLTHMWHDSWARGPRARGDVTHAYVT